MCNYKLIEELSKTKYSNLIQQFLDEKVLTIDKVMNLIYKSEQGECTQRKERMKRIHIMRDFKQLLQSKIDKIRNKYDIKSVNRQDNTCDPQDTLNVNNPSRIRNKEATSSYLDLLESNQYNKMSSVKESKENIRFFKEQTRQNFTFRMTPLKYQPTTHDANEVVRKYGDLKLKRNFTPPQEIAEIINSVREDIIKNLSLEPPKKRITSIPKKFGPRSVSQNREVLVTDIKRKQGRTQENFNKKKIGIYRRYVLFLTRKSQLKIVSQILSELNIKL